VEEGDEEDKKPVYTYAGCIQLHCLLLGLRIMHPCTYLLTYTCSWLCAYKTGNISETVENGAKVTINGLYKIIYGLSIATKMYDLEWPLSEIQGHWFSKCRKMTKYSFIVMIPTHAAM